MTHLLVKALNDFDKLLKSGKPISSKCRVTTIDRKTGSVVKRVGPKKA